MPKRQKKFFLFPPIFWIALGAFLLGLGGCTPPGAGVSETGGGEGRGGSERSRLEAPAEIAAETPNDAALPPEGSTVEEPPPEPPSPEPSSEPLPEPPSPEPSPETGIKTPITCSPPPADILDRVGSWSRLLVDGPEAGRTLPPCRLDAWRLVAAASQEITLEVRGIPPKVDLRLHVLNARRINRIASDKPLASASSQGQGWIYLTATIDQSGEIGVLLEGHNLQTTVPYKIRAYCSKHCHLEATRYPVVLMHGFAGTDTYFGILDYFYQVPSFLTQKGFSVFATQVQPIANSSTRVLSLKSQIDAIFQRTGAAKLNLIAHSQGGVDGRLLISKHLYGDRIASLTTISTPHRGVPVPNLLIPPSAELGEDNMALYNRTYLNDPRVKYFSWAGVSCAPLDRACRQKYNDEVVDPLILAIYEGLLALRGPNDGIVPVSSAIWGTYLGEIPADHFDEIGQIADTNNKPFQHKDFYLQELRRLRSKEDL